MNRRLVARISLLAAWSLLLVGVGWGARGWQQRRHEAARERRVRLPGFRLVSPLLDVELPEGASVDREPIPFKYKVERYVQAQLASRRARDVSVYYRDLLDGPWFGVNENRKYNPASMMKVPVMIAWLKRAERDPRALEEAFVFDERGYPGRPQTIAPERSLVAGGRYTVEELLRYMLAYSDNKAMWLLFNALRPEELADVLDSMDVSNDPDDTTNAMSAHGYSGFFRILYNASYLGREMSGRALELLTIQEFPRGIAAGVPKGVTVAAKFGESTSGERGAEVQLHEFGIVYHPRGPYILGVMTAGSDWGTQADIIKEVSSLVYEEIESQAARGPKGSPPTSRRN